MRIYIKYGIKEIIKGLRSTIIIEVTNGRDLYYATLRAGDM